jgi:uncharacterized protein (DUF1697 family)
MARQIVFLRGVNLGARNRVSMAELRDLLARAGFDDVRTYLQSGNVILSSTASSKEVARRCEREIARGLGLRIDVVVRTRTDLARVVKRDPLGDVAVNPKRYQVSFLSAAPKRALTDKLAAAAAPEEKFVVIGREIYAWHPEGVGRSRLGALLAGRDLGVTATARNWTTVTKVLALADDE